jgi:hypothetical protein
VGSAAGPNGLANAQATAFRITVLNWYRIRYHSIVSASKTRLKMRKNPMGWRIEDLQMVASDHHITWRSPGRGGSHVIFGASGIREIVTVPSKRPIKPIYIKFFLALIDSVGELKTNEKN